MTSFRNNFLLRKSRKYFIPQELDSKYFLTVQNDELHLRFYARFDFVYIHNVFSLTFLICSGSDRATLDFLFIQGALNMELSSFISMTF